MAGRKRKTTDYRAPLLPFDDNVVRKGRARVGIVDADLLDHGTRHPNLALMKLSGWYNGVHRNDDGSIWYPQDDERLARLVLESDIQECQTLSEFVGSGDESKFDKLVISQVFDFSKLPEVLQMAYEKGLLHEGTSDVQDYRCTKQSPCVVYGGTGFVKDLERLPNCLPDEIEHHFPDYHLYDAFVDHEINVLKKKEVHYKDYRNYSIGFLTRGCFRKCPFCVNKHKSAVAPHSHINEFFDPARKYVYLWDDNFLGFIAHADKNDEQVANGNVTWETLLEELRKTNRPFQFRQGLDIRLMTPEIAKKLSECHYHGDYIFAFDHYNQKKQIVKGIRNWKTANPQVVAKFYVLCGFRCVGREVDDILETLKRIRILMQFGMLPYIMRHEDYKKSVFSGLYTQLARWCNQPQFFKKKSFDEFVEANQYYHSMNAKAQKTKCASMVALEKFRDSGLVSSDGRSTADIALDFFDLKFEKLRNRWSSKEGLVDEPEL